MPLITVVSFNHKQRTIHYEPIKIKHSAHASNPYGLSINAN